MKNFLILLVIGSAASCQLKSPKNDNIPLLTASAGDVETDVTDTSAAKKTGALFLDETPVVFQHLQLYAIRRTQTATGDMAKQANYKTLKEALETNQIKVTESGGGNGDAVNEIAPTTDEVSLSPRGGETVNTLQVENTSNDTLFLMAGELVKGGKQDRVIAQDMILPPKSGKQALPVFCVEHGRWTYKDNESASFSGYSNVASNSVRKAVVTAKDQGTVWSEVDEVTKANTATSGTSTYNALEKSDAFVTKRQPYLDFFKDKYKNQPEVVGVIALSGDSIIGADVFYNSFMFQKQYPNLLYSYVADVVTKPISTTASLLAAKKCFDSINLDFTQTEKAADGKITNKNRVIHMSKF